MLAGLSLVVVAMLGCGEQAAPAKSSGKPKPSAELNSSTKKDEAPPASFGSVPEALAAVEAMSESGNPSSQELMRIEQWLGDQGNSAAPALTTALGDDKQHLAVRITACRALSRLGASGKEPLLQATAAEPRQLRLKATECLGRVKPTDKQIVDKLVGMVDHDDFDQRKAALTALANIGPAASKADPQLPQKLMGILNDTKQDETIRGLAKTALKKVDPRTGLQNAY